MTVRGLGKVVIQYELLDSFSDVAYNIQDCLVWLQDEVESESKLGPIECSAQKFDRYDSAFTYAKDLFDYGSSHILKFVGLVKHGNEGGIVFVERVIPLENWITTRCKPEMWRRKDGACIGVGEAFKTIFQQMLSALKYIHDELNKTHNNLKHGVYLTPDRKRVRLGNFFFGDKTTPKKFVYNKKEDFKAFQTIFESAVEKDYPGGSIISDNVKTQVAEVRLFLELLKKVLANDNNFIAKCGFMYNPFILWGPKTKRLFYDEFVYAMKLNTKETIKKLDMKRHFGEGTNWQTRISTNSVWHNTLTHQPSVLYLHTFGPVAIIRNFDHHRPISIEDVFDQADFLFPEALGACVYSLLFATFGSISLNPLYKPGSKQPPKFACDFIFKGLLSILEYQPV